MSEPWHDMEHGGTCFYRLKDIFCCCGCSHEYGPAAWCDWDDSVPPDAYHVDCALEVCGGTEEQWDQIEHGGEFILDILGWIRNPCRGCGDVEIWFKPGKPLAEIGNCYCLECALSVDGQDEYIWDIDGKIVVIGRD